MGISASDLRRGNLFYMVSRKGEIHLPVDFPLKVVALPFDKIQCVGANENEATVVEWKEVDYRDSSPIPLTEEWLIKLGFEVIADGYNSLLSFYGHKHFSLSWFLVKNKEINSYNIAVNFSGFNNNSYCPNKDNNIFHVHELQNTIRYVTGKELTVKEGIGK